MAIRPIIDEAPGSRPLLAGVVESIAQLPPTWRWGPGR
jgi:hypothetical protein